MKRILDTLDQVTIESLPRVDFHKDEILFQEDDICQGVGILLSGRIKIASYTLEGLEIIYNTLEAGEMFGQNLLFSSSPLYRGNVIAIKDGSMLILSEENLLSILRSNPEFLKAYLQSQAEWGKAVNAKLKLLSLDKAEERFELYMSLHQGRIEFKSVSALAKEMFLSRETLSRLLTSLINQGRIARDGNSIWLLGKQETHP